MPFILFYIFAVPVFCMGPLIIGVWLILLIRFGLLSLLLEWLQVLPDQKTQITRYVTQMLSRFLMIGFFVLPFLACHPYFVLWLSNFGETIIDERLFHIGWTFLVSPTWIALVVEAWLALAVYFGLCYLQSRLGVPVNNQQSTTSYTMIGMALIGFFTGLIGLRQWINMAMEDISSFETVKNFGYVVLSPTIDILTVGLLVMLYISLGKSLLMDENIKQHQQIAKKMTIIVLLTLLILGVVGGLLSIYIHNVRQGFFPSLG